MGRHLVQLVSLLPNLCHHHIQVHFQQRELMLKDHPQLREAVLQPTQAGFQSADCVQNEHFVVVRHVRLHLRRSITRWPDELPTGSTDMPRMARLDQSGFDVRIGSSTDERQSFLTRLLTVTSRADFPSNGTDADTGAGVARSGRSRRSMCAYPLPPRACARYL